MPFKNYFISFDVECCSAVWMIVVFLKISLLFFDKLSVAVVVGHQCGCGVGAGLGAFVLAHASCRQPRTLRTKLPSAIRLECGGGHFADERDCLDVRALVGPAEAG